MSTVAFKYSVLVKSEDKTYGFTTAAGVAHFCLSYQVDDLEITKNGKPVVVSKDGVGVSTEELRRILEAS